MAEVFRIEIPVQVMDQTNPGLNNAAKRVNNFEVSIRRTKKQLEEMNQTRWQLTLYALDRTQQTLNRVRSSLFGVVGRTWNISVGILGAPLQLLNRIQSTLFSIPTLLTAMGGGLAVKKGFADPLSMANDFEDARIAFETMLGGREQGDNFLRSLDEFAERTPFTTAGLRDMSQRMLAFKFQSQQVIPYLTAIGDWAGMMGKGEVGIDRVTLALGQIKAKGRVQGDEMLQLTEAGINAYDYLSEAMGKTTQELMKMQEKGLIPADKAIDAIIQGMTRDFGGGMKRQEANTRGLWNTIKETFDNRIVRRWGDGISKGINPALAKMVGGIDENRDGLDKWSEAMERAGKTLGTTVGNGIDWVKGKVTALTSSKEWKEAGTLGDKISASMNFMTNEGLFRSAGEFLGGVLKGGIMTALGILDPSGSVDDSTFVGAGQRAGKSFMDGFLAEFDAGEVTKKFGEVVKNTVVPSSDKSLLGNIAGLGGGVLAGGWLLSKLFPMLKWAGPVGGAIGGGMLGSQLGGSMFGDQGEAWGGVLGGLAGGALLSWPFLKRVPGWIKKGIGRKAAPKLPTATPTPLEVGPRTSVPILGPDGKPIKNVLQDPTTSSTRPPNLKNEGLGAPSTKPGFLKSVIRSPYLKGFGLAGSVIGGAQILMADSTTDRGAGIGSMTGTLLGGAIGTLAGPIGTAIGSAAGGFLGNWLGGKIGGLFENDPIPVQAPTEHKISITVNTEPRFDIQTAANAGDVLSIIRSNLREVGNVISGELAERIEESYNNMA